MSVKKGESIISAFKKIKQDIAHYCWHPGLSTAGVCRLCMVEIQGNPKLQIACNTEVTEGMVISNQSEKVKQAVRWGLEFHLINHPLDCPICDQAGECELQEQYLRFGKYAPGMGERKVKKRKALDLGSKIVLDTERCILCTRCVRFTEEVSKTNELGIFNRGDKSEIGVFKDKPLNNNYAVNTVDICPVGALTSKEFRFQQRVWYLKTADSICTGCSTGCNTQIDYNEEGLFRVRPRYNEKINKHWMCDKGRALYQLPNAKGRLLQALYPSSMSELKNLTLEDSLNSDVDSSAGFNNKPQNNNKKACSTVQALKVFKNRLLKENQTAKALILTGQYTTEEYENLISFFVNLPGGGKDSVYYWKNNEKSFDDFDGLLLRGDKNPNTKGVLKVLEKYNVNTKWQDLESRLNSKELNLVFVAGPENQKAYPDLKQKLASFVKHCENILWWTAHPLPKISVENKDPTKKLYGKNLKDEKVWQIPSKTFFEKSGSYINHAGIVQKVKATALLAPAALSLSESSAVLKGEALITKEPEFLNTMKTNYFTAQKRTL